MPTTISGNTGVSQVQDGVIDADALATLTKPLGVGQTWQDVLTSRAANTVYTNTTGRPIMVNAWAQGNAFANRFIELYVNSILIDRDTISLNGDGDSPGNAGGIIPAGQTYEVRLPQGGVINGWVELR